MCVRYFVHGVVRREYAKIKADEEIPHLYFAGHSLGGAIATIASADVTINSLPRINKYLKVKRYVPSCHVRIHILNAPVCDGLSCHTM